MVLKFGTPVESVMVVEGLECCAGVKGQLCDWCGDSIGEANI